MKLRALIIRSDDTKIEACDHSLFVSLLLCHCFLHFTKGTLDAPWQADAVEQRRRTAKLREALRKRDLEVEGLKDEILAYKTETQDAVAGWEAAEEREANLGRC